MQKAVFLFALLLVAASAGSAGIGCYQYVSDVMAVYDLKNIQSSVDYSIDLGFNTTLYYNYCTGTVRKCNGQNTTAAFIQYSDGHCELLTNETVPQIQAANETDPLAGIVLDYQPYNGFNLSVQLSCDETYNNTQYNYDTYSESVNNTIVIHATAKSGCPSVAYYQIANFVDQYRLIFIIAGAVLGLFECFLGLKLFKPTLFITGFLIVFLIFFSLLFTFVLGATPTKGAEWGCLVVSIVLGAIAGYLLVKFEKVGVFLLGAWLGVIGSFLLYSLIVVHFGFGTGGLVGFTIVCAILGGVVAYFVFDHLVIIATGVAGAYIAIRSLSLFIAKYPFPSEFDIARDIEYGNYGGIPGAFYVYFAVIVVLAIFGIVVQYKHKSDRDEEKDQDVQYGYAGLNAYPA